jgi:hypothetical protein
MAIGLSIYTRAGALALAEYARWDRLGEMKCLYVFRHGVLLESRTEIEMITKLVGPISYMHADTSPRGFV